ncbi:MAG: c-type cytochrome [bacterium]
MKRSFTSAMAVAAVVASVWVFALPPGTTEEISQRIDPFGSVSRVGDAGGAAVASASAEPRSGQAVYDQFCFACHTTGVGGAPTFGDTAQWAERVDQGMDLLMEHTINGIRTMPAKGTCMNCSDDELNAAVTYILDNLP